jgi:hypothetical protein
MKKRIDNGMKNNYLCVSFCRKNVKVQNREAATSTQLVQKKKVIESEKPFLIYKSDNNNTYDFFDGKTSWKENNATF